MSAIFEVGWDAVCEPISQLTVGDGFQVTWRNQVGQVMVGYGLAGDTCTTSVLSAVFLFTR